MRLYTSSHGVPSRPGRLHVSPGDRRIQVDRIVTVPRLVGPALQGMPCDRDGFIRTDAHGRVLGMEDVFAAGDATAFPIKQGGLAAQQADAVAESIAASVGADVAPRPFRPVLRGLLTAGGAARYMRARIANRHGRGLHPLRAAVVVAAESAVRTLPRAVPQQPCRWRRGHVPGPHPWPSGSIPRRATTRASSASWPTCQPLSRRRDPYQ